MTDNHTELCERLRQASTQCSDCGMYETSSDFDLAVSMIESQAARIQQQALEYASLFDQRSQHLARIAELEKERDALKADAGRWHLARDQATIYQGNNVGCFVEFKKYEAMPSERHRSGRAFTDAVDAAIDAAIMEKSDDRS